MTSALRSLAFALSAISLASACANESGPPRGPGSACSTDDDCTDEADWEAGGRCVAGGCGCVGDEDCRGVCNQELSVCMECVTDADCSPTFTTCHENRCVDCVESSDCGPDFPVCGARTCVECVADSDCATSANGARCFDAVYCGCNSDADCPTGNRCDTMFCEPRCTSDADCGGGLVCNTTSGACLECLTDANCAGHPNGDLCQPDGWCGCATDADCASSPSGRVCFADDARCGCRDFTHCPPEWPSCDMRNSCR